MQLSNGDASILGAIQERFRKVAEGVDPADLADFLELDVLFRDKNFRALIPKLRKRQKRMRFVPRLV